ncbi:uncharacterized protein RJT20DRAFT_125657 [Scheffersomyces xylosifermentans]|uniref:uncharacterized protein n=1 Tax=Scheffersomyces xylosifermentans TaxID=1304137 RepID=UPI00315C6DAC
MPENGGEMAVPSISDGPESMIVTTLGMFIIDENQYPESWNRKTEHNIVGGGGPYAIVGARIIAGAKYGTRVSGIIDKGSDFPDSVQNQLSSWQSGIVFREDPTRLTTRGINKYDENDIRHFEYKTPKKRIEVEDILEFPVLRSSKCFHLICSIDRCDSIISLLNEKLDHKPVYIYEPLPDDCVAENFEKLTKLLPKVHIFTPNLDEACALSGVKELPSTTNGLQEVSSRFKKYLKLDNSGTILRCGALGCYIHTLEDYRILLPAYHTDQNKVIDVTGGGNSFCGGCIAGFFLSGGNWLIAGISGNLASGCVIERLGMPGKDAESEEWNGLTLSERIDVYFKNNSDLLQSSDRSSFSWI